MNGHQKQKLSKLADGKILFDCPMAEYTTFRVGGPCEALYRAGDADNLKRVIQFLKHEKVPYFLVGRGSNLLIKDNGIRGVGIILERSLAEIRQKTPGQPDLTIGGGAFLADLLGFCRNYGLGGMEWAAGIPGTVGGAVAMNAGAHDEEISSRIKNIRVLTSKGEWIGMAPPGLRFSYRHLELQQGIVVTEVEMALKPDTRENISEKMTRFLKQRKTTQPLEYPNAGSVFKNPPGDYAGRLIEIAGLKGEKRGDAMISLKHANFIINTGHATAKDILELMDFAINRVEGKTGIKLEPEIRIMGN